MSLIVKIQFPITDAVIVDQVEITWPTGEIGLYPDLSEGIDLSIEECRAISEISRRATGQQVTYAASKHGITDLDRFYQKCTLLGLY